jgi:hypothetical protein
MYKKSYDYLENYFQSDFERRNILARKITPNPIIIRTRRNLDETSDAIIAFIKPIIINCIAIIIQIRNLFSILFTQQNDILLLTFLGG